MYTDVRHLLRRRTARSRSVRRDDVRLASRLTARRHRQLSHRSGYVSRPPERVRLRDDARRARIRRPGERGRQQQSVRWRGRRRGRRRKTDWRVRRRIQSELGRRVGSANVTTGSRLVGGVRDPVQDAAIRARHRPRVGREFSADDPASQRDGVLGASPDSVRPDARVARRRADRHSTSRSSGTSRSCRTRSAKRGNAARDGETKFFGDIGLDAKYSVTPSLTLDTTVNTDFAQVEVDEQQVNLDRFNLFFPEKRPFFLENAGLFAVGSSGEAEVFFSRRIGIGEDGEEIPILAGARLSGRRRANQYRTAQHADRRSASRLRQQLHRRPRSPGPEGPLEHRRDLRRPRRPPARRRERQSQPSRSPPMAGGASAARAHLRIRRPDGHAGVTEDQHAFQLQARNDTQPLTLTLGYLETGRNFNPEVGFLSRLGGFRKLEPRFSRACDPSAGRSFRRFDRTRTTARTGTTMVSRRPASGTSTRPGSSRAVRSSAPESTSHVKGSSRRFEIYPGVDVPAAPTIIRKRS